MQFEKVGETDPRNNKIRLTMRVSTAQESNNLTIPRNKRLSKRMFFGEYDATADEEQSLAKSQIRNDVCNFISSDLGSPLNKSPVTQTNNFSTGIDHEEGRPSLLKLQVI